jgi:predicted AlkP superfamily phosphohydrolase/phosphomutase
MTEQRFKVAAHLLATRPWDFFMMVEIGVDRIHHAFWSYLDSRHAKYVPNHRYANVIRDYYHYLDGQIGALLASFDDQTTVFLVSDHGAQPMEGAICVNEWLMREGYLVLKEPVTGVMPLARAKVDWSRTKAWGEGGYYCRLCLNVEGREPQGIVSPRDYEAVRDELKAKLEALPDPDGRPIGTIAHRPEELWPTRRGIVPDLVVYFGNLAWRSNGSVGLGRIHSFDNDTGPDDANHAPDGVFAMAGPGVQPGPRTGLRIYDVAPTILNALGVDIPLGLRGRVVEPTAPSYQNGRAALAGLPAH